MMKKKILYMMAMALPLMAMGSCRQGNSTGDEAKAKADSLAAQAAKDSIDHLNAMLEAQGGLYMTSDVEKYWPGRTIRTDARKEDVTTLFEAFNREFPTREGNTIVKKTNPAAVYGDTYSGNVIIDRANGYVESPWVDGGPSVSACVWERKNGHKLFAVHMGMYQEDTDEFVCFYDYNPTTHTLTPEESPVKKQHLLFPQKRPNSFLLPREGKNFIVRESGESLNYEGIYTFDGQNLQCAGHDTGWNERLEEEYCKGDNDDVHDELTQFALIDIDEDGKEELWLRSDDEAEGAIFYFTNGYPHLLITESDRMRPSFAKGRVAVGGPAGGPSYFTTVVTVKKSQKEHTFTDFQVEEQHEYTLDEKDIGEAEGKAFRKSLQGDYKELTPKWYKLVNKYKLSGKN